MEEADKTHEIIQITRHGHPSAVLMSAADPESLQETMIWTRPGATFRTAIRPAVMISAMSSDCRRGD